jgi:alkylation response protein AidB-like acyl-CoA dehydrogenase
MNAIVDKPNTTLTFSDEQAMILESAKDFCRDKSPIAAVRSLLESETGYDAAVWQEMVALGWTGLAIPEAYGGAGFGVGSLVPVAEAMGRAMLATPFFSSALAAQALLRGGNEQQRDAWLPRLAEGAVGSLALLDSEDWGELRPQSLATGEAELALTGTKWYVTDAAVADFFLVAVEHNGSAALALVTREQLPDGAIRPHGLIDETKRASKVVLDGVRIPATALLPADDFPALCRDLRLLGALLTAAEATGTTAACLDTVVDYLGTRKQFGRLIGSYQALKHPTVNILTGMDAARSHIYHAASIVGEGPLDRDAEIACRMAKAQASDALTFAGDRAVQFHGGMGFTYECDAQLYIRRAQWAQQHFGDAYHHRKRLAALLLD